MKFQPKQNSQNQSQSNNPEATQPEKSQAETVSSSANDGSHLEILSIEHITGEAEQESPDGSAGEQTEQQDNSRNIPPHALEKEAFYAQFAGAHKIISMMTGLRSMAIQPDEQDTAMEASNAIYDTAVDLEWYWMISGGGKWFQRLTVLGMFFMGKAQMVAQERQAIMAEMEKEQQKEQESQKTEAPKDDTTPPPGWEWMKEAKNAG